MVSPLLLLLLLLLLASSCFCAATTTTVSTTSTTSSFSSRDRSLPKKVLMGYANVNECDDKILQAVKDGANVVTWFSINLVQDSSSLVSVAGFSQFACAANISSALKSLGFDNITHLISIGGWGVPHIDAASISPAQAYAAWKSWNSPVNGFQFDGIDWDVEGDDTVSSPNNYMTLPLLQLMGQVSQMAKADGFIVTLVPLLTYIDPFQSGFDRYLNHSTTTSFHPESQYRGRNSHSYLIAKYGISTFDLITIQLYEPYSYLQQNVTMFNQTVSNYLVNLVKSYSTGWTVKFSMDPTCGLPDQVVKVDASRLLIAFEIASEMDNVKKWVVEPNQIVKSYIALMQQGVDLRGYAYWSIRDDGMTPPVAGASAISYSKSLGSLINNSSIALGNSSGGSGSSSSGNNGGGGGSSSSASPSAGSHASALHISSLLSSIFVLSTMLTQI